MSTTTTAGGAGGKADQIAAEARVAALGYRAGGIAAGIAGIAAMLFLPGVPGPVLAVVGVVAAPLLWMRAPAAAKPAGRANRGNDAEAEILAAIQTVPGVAWVEQGRQLAASRRSKEDVDFVVCMDTGVLVVIEAKAAHGRMTLTNGVLYTASRAIHGKDLTNPGGSPMAQASRGALNVGMALEAAGVKRVLPDLPFRVVCAHRGVLREPIQTEDGQYHRMVGVCNAAQLPALLTNLGEGRGHVAPADIHKARKAIRRAHHKR